jgi:hypothetical protein
MTRDQQARRDGPGPACSDRDERQARASGQLGQDRIAGPDDSAAQHDAHDPGLPPDTTRRRWSPPPGWRRISASTGSARWGEDWGAAIAYAVAAVHRTRVQLVFQETLLPGLAPPSQPDPSLPADDGRTGWHFSFFGVANLPELLLAGRERPRRAELPTAMGASSVVVSLILCQDRPQMPRAEDEHPVGDLGPGGEHEPFRIRVRARAPGRDFHDLDT